MCKISAVAEMASLHSPYEPASAVRRASFFLLPVSLFSLSSTRTKFRTWWTSCCLELVRPVLSGAGFLLLI